VSIDPNNPLSLLLDHGFGQLHDHLGQRTLTLTFTPAPGESLVDFQARIQRQRLADDAVTVTVRNQRIVLIEVVRSY
jgi:hypothetical protein